MSETTITRRAALRTIGAVAMTMTAAAVLPSVPAVAAAPIAPADLLAGWEPTYALRYARPDEFAAVRAVALGFSKQIAACHDLADRISAETGEDRPALFDELAGYAVFVERFEAVQAHGREAGLRIVRDGLLMACHASTLADEGYRVADLDRADRAHILAMLRDLTADVAATA